MMGMARPYQKFRYGGTIPRLVSTSMALCSGWEGEKNFELQF